MTAEEAKIEQAIRAARIAKQTLLEETRNSMPLEVDEELVKVKRPKAENVTIKVPNQDKEGFGLAGVEEEYKIKKAVGYDMVLEDIKGTRDAELAIESFLVAASSRVHYDKPSVPVPEKLMSMVRDYLETGFDKFKKSMTDEDKKGYPYRLGVALEVIKIVRDYLKNKSSVGDLTDKDFKNIKRVIDKYKDILDF